MFLSSTVLRTTNCLARHQRHARALHIKPFELAYDVIKPLRLKGNPEGPLVILHGLFGSKRNWKSLCKAFQRDLETREVYALDLRNHGSSPRVHPHTYEAMAEDVLHFIKHHGLTDVTLMGHSMGAKTAMTLALSLAGEKQSEDVISRLIVVDMAPVRYVLSHRLSEYVEAMKNMHDMPRGMDPAIRQFLLTNLEFPSSSRTDAKPRFQLPLETLGGAIPAMGDFSYDHGTEGHPIWEKPALVVAGANSEYAILQHLTAFKSFFPGAQVETLDTGHWGKVELGYTIEVKCLLTRHLVQAERPNEFKKLVVDFIKKSS
ncbi:mitochondrial protein [Coprinopsis sp. MPI-PUGE-AT-0042]|nr:mitochondrial protein [Coprinopsis sp. MPI-PUGE-AT-0042]